MIIPQALRKQAQFYASRGFHMIHAEPRAGSHFMVRFAEFKQGFILSIDCGDRRVLHNNIAAFRRLRRST
ncbi:hypothetical protein UFOVP229_26 [uncultured Caudovirales phage]|uniref:Uncharacterized protein n=1 Tax=uncultured Caudovirales phage TaxID=2100421 RepID=A0A6J7WMN3_9CAUD|nr:hypothetical protein UFOVP229_26 [uncultured Caudovirales phage]